MVKHTGTLSVALCKLVSWSYLFTQYGYGDNQDGSKGVRSYPINHILSGYFTWNTSRLYQNTFGGYNWSSSVQSNDAGYRLTVSGDNVKYSVTLTKLYGLPLRCVFGS